MRPRECSENALGSHFAGRSPPPARLAPAASPGGLPHLYSACGLRFERPPEESRMPTDLLRTDNVRLELDGAVATLTLTRPSRLNAMSPGLVDDMHSCLDVLARTRAARVVILTGEGRGFCAGLDLQEYGKWTITEGLDSVEGGL